MTTPLWRAPGFPVGVALLIAPVACLLQSKAMAPVGLVPLALAVIAHWRLHARLPWPSAASGWVAVMLGLWSALSAAWALEPLRALESGVALAAMALLAGGAARAVAEDERARGWVALCAALGLGLGLVASAADAATGNALRAAVRGLREAPPTLAFGLKPAASVMAMLLPLAAAAPLGRWWRVALLVLGAVVLALLPGDSAKIAGFVGVAAVGLALWMPRLTPRALGAALAALVLATPMLLGLVLQAGLPVERLPPSAIHRLVIWEFARERIAERPLLGWGMEASRAVPGGTAPPAPAELDRLGVTRPDLRAWFALPHIQVLPLHPHNGALQLWLELGLAGALLGAALLVLLGRAAAGAPCPAAATGALAAAAVTFLLSFGIWQAWWVAAQLLAVAALAGLPRVSSSGRAADGR